MWPPPSVLATACVSFGIGPVRPFLVDIWDGLRQEILHNQTDSDDVSAAALVTVQVLVATAAAERSGSAPPDDDVQPLSIGAISFIDRLLVEATRELKVPDSKLARQFAKVVAAACGRELSTGAGVSVTPPPPSGARRAVAVLVLERLWPVMAEKLQSPHLQPQQQVRSTHTHAHTQPPGTRLWDSSL